MKNSPIQFVYVSASGNTLAVVDYVAKKLESKGHPVIVTRVEQFDHQKVISESSRYIFAKSTWVHGELNPYFEPLLRFFESNKVVNIEAAFIGTGDLRYDPILFCNGMEILRKAFIKSGGKEITDPLKINGDPHEQLDTVVSKWIEKLISSINELDK